MWQPLFVTLVVAVSAVLGQFGNQCNQLETGEASPNMVLLKRVNLRAHESYPVDARFPCNGQRPIGMYVIACSAEREWPPYISGTDNVYVVNVKTVEPATVDILAYCEDPIDNNTRRKQDPHLALRRKYHHY